MTKPAILTALLLLALAVLAAAPFVGMERMPLATLWGGLDEPAKEVIFWKLRVPRVLMAMLAGMALSMGGMSFQAMFRNPLATPFTLGVSSGASLGAAMAMFWGLQFSFLGVSSTAVFALGGAIATILLVYSLTRARRGFSTPTLLLAGVAINFFFSSLILFLQYQSNPTRTLQMLRWVMGGMDSVNYRNVLGVLPFVASGCLILFWLTHELNLMTTGEELAASRGVEVEPLKRTVFFAASLMVGGVVAVCGPIGFVGLMAPHICRLVIGADHRWLAPATLVFGGAFLVLCDTVARTVLAPAELPVGIITSLLGGPFFLWLLLRGRGEVDIGL